jgi:hypothetical protein
MSKGSLIMAEKPAMMDDDLSNVVSQLPIEMHVTA